MSISSVSNSSNANTSKRYTGLSGLDVESLVNAGLVGIKSKINKTKQIIPMVLFTAYLPMRILHYVFDEIHKLILIICGSDYVLVEY